MTAPSITSADPTYADMKADVLAKARTELMRSGMSREHLLWAMGEVRAAYELGFVHACGGSRLDMGEVLEGVFGVPRRDEGTIA